MKKILKLFVLAFVLIQLLAESLIFFYTREPFVDEKFDTIILLGVSGRLLSDLSNDRIRLAAEASVLWPDAKILITGNGALDEVSSLKKGILTKGVSPQRIIEETQSRDTWDNMVLSKKLLPADAKVVIITNEFHQLR